MEKTGSEDFRFSCMCVCVCVTLRKTLYGLQPNCVKLTFFFSFSITYNLTLKILHAYKFSVVGENLSVKLLHISSDVLKLRDSMHCKSN